MRRENLRAARGICGDIRSRAKMARRGSSKRGAFRRAYLAVSRTSCISFLD